MKEEEALVRKDMEFIHSLAKLIGAHLEESQSKNPSDISRTYLLLSKMCELTDSLRISFEETVKIPENIRERVKEIRTQGIHALMELAKKDSLSTH